MKKYILDKKLYTFNASSSTITISPEIKLTLDNILLIVNVEDGTTIYNFACEGVTGELTNNVLSLNYNTSAMEDTDNLMVILVTSDTSDETNSSIELNTDETTKTLKFITLQLKEITNLLTLILS